MGPLFVVDTISSEKSLLPRASYFGLKWAAFGKSFSLFEMAIRQLRTGQHSEALPPHEEAAHKAEHPTRGPVAAGETAREVPIDRSGPVRAEFRAGELLDLRRHEGVRCRHDLLNVGRQRSEGAFADSTGAHFGARGQTSAGCRVPREEDLCAHCIASHPNDRRYPDVFERERLRVRQSARRSEGSATDRRFQIVRSGHYNTPEDRSFR